jgi:DNA-binding NarL/FixJ family response regulator
VTAPFSPADLALVALIAEGHGNRDIAAKLDLTLGTLKYRIECLIRSRRTCSRAALVAQACHAGQLGPAASEPLVLPCRLREILPGLAAGWSNPRIGKSLFLSADTVKGREVQLFALLGANGRANAILLAYRAGLLQEAGR